MAEQEEFKASMSDMTGWKRSQQGSVMGQCEREASRDYKFSGQDVREGRKD